MQNKCLVIDRGYDNDEGLTDIKTPLTTVAYRTEDIGRLAAQVLKKMIDKKEKDVFAYYLVEPSIVARESCLGKKR